MFEISNMGHLWIYVDGVKTSVHQISSMADNKIIWQGGFVVTFDANGGTFPVVTFNANGGTIT